MQANTPSKPPAGPALPVDTRLPTVHRFLTMIYFLYEYHTGHRPIRLKMQRENVLYSAGPIKKRYSRLAIS
jgi:hypothetical protein